MATFHLSMLLLLLLLNSYVQSEASSITGDPSEADQCTCDRHEQTCAFTQDVGSVVACKETIRSLIFRHCRLDDIATLQDIPALKHLRRLEVWDCNLRVISPHSFSAFSHLRILGLHKNNITEIKEQSVTGLARVRIQLSNNTISKVHSRAFEGVNKINLNYNDIKEQSGTTPQGISEVEVDNLKKQGQNTSAEAIATQTPTLGETINDSGDNDDKEILNSGTHEIKKVVHIGWIVFFIGFIIGLIICWFIARKYPQLLDVFKSPFINNRQDNNTVISNNREENEESRLEMCNHWNVESQSHKNDYKSNLLTK